MDAHKHAAKRQSKENPKKSSSLLRTFKYAKSSLRNGAKNRIRKGFTNMNIDADTRGARYDFNRTGKQFYVEDEELIKKEKRTKLPVKPVHKSPGFAS